MSITRTPTSIKFRPEGEDQPDAQVVPSFDLLNGLPIKIMPRAAFVGVVIPIGHIYVDVDTKRVYLGDGVTPGGVDSSDYLFLEKIDGGPILNSRFDTVVIGGGI